MEGAPFTYSMGVGGRTHSCTLLHTVYNLVCKNIYARSDYMDVVIVSQVYAHVTLISLLIFGPHGACMGDNCIVCME